MVEFNSVRESVRSLERDGREFVLRYSFTVEGSKDEPKCRIHASLSERTSKGPGSKTSCSIEMSHLNPKMGRRIFEMIAGAEDPVFPVHIAEIVRDQLAVTEIVTVKQEQPR